MTHRPERPRRGRWLVVLLACACASTAPARATPPGPLVRLLARDPLPDGDLVVRLIEVDGQRVALASRYAAGHPLMKEVARRAALLQQAAEHAAPADAEARLRVAAYLRTRLAEIEALRVEHAARGHGPSHESLRHLQATRTYLVELVTALGPVPEAADADRRRAEALVQRADAAGRLSFLATRYTDKHPRVVLARALLADADARLAPAGGRLDAGVCRLLPRAFDRALLERRTHLASLDARAPVALELEAGLDGILVERAVSRAACQPKRAR